MATIPEGFTLAGTVNPDTGKAQVALECRARECRQHVWLRQVDDLEAIVAAAIEHRRICDKHVPYKRYRPLANRWRWLNGTARHSGADGAPSPHPRAQAH